MKQSIPQLFLLFSPFPLWPQNMLTQLLQARSKSVWKTLNPYRLAMRKKRSLNPLRIDRLEGDCPPSNPWKFVSWSLPAAGPFFVWNFSTTPSNCNSKRIPLLLPLLRFPAPVCAILSTYETKSQPPPPPSLFFPKSVFHFVFFLEGLCLKLDAKKSVKPFLISHSLEKNTFSHPDLTDYGPSLMGEL